MSIYAEWVWYAAWYIKDYGRQKSGPKTGFRGWGHSRNILDAQRAHRRTVKHLMEIRREIPNFSENEACAACMDLIKMRGFDENVATDDIPRMLERLMKFTAATSITLERTIKPVRPVANMDVIDNRIVYG